MMSQVGWTFEEDKAFEMALARYFTDADRWVKIANVLPHKTPTDVQQRFWALETDIRRIEDGCGRPTTPCLPQMVGAPSPTVADCKKVKLETAINGDRRKGVPWTEEEHRLFLLGLAKFGKGDWRSIARNFVVSRTPTQVASHAQKYFIRLNSLNKKDKRRASIHDITSVGNNGCHSNNNHWAEAAGRTQAQPPTSQAGGSASLPAVYM